MKIRAEAAQRADGGHAGQAQVQADGHGPGDEAGQAARLDVPESGALGRLHCGAPLSGAAPLSVGPPPCTLPLAGLKVLDLSRLLPGPYATLVLADLGATVDKVEEPDGRRLHPPDAARCADDESALFYGAQPQQALAHAGPQVARGARRRSSGWCAATTCWWRASGPASWTSWASATRRCARRTRGSSTAPSPATGRPGRTGSRRGTTSTTSRARACSATAASAGGAPAFPGVQMADIGGGSLFALVGILAALHERAAHRAGPLRRRVHDGRRPGLPAHAPGGAAGDGRRRAQPLRRGRETLNGGYACYGLYRTQDGRYLAVGALEPKFLSGLCERAGPAGPAARTPTTPGEARSAREGRARAPLRRAPAGALAGALRRARTSASSRCWRATRCSQDPQLRARGLFVEAEDAQRGRRVTHLLTPLRMGETPLRPPPALGQHSREILDRGRLHPRGAGGLGVGLIP